MFHRIPVGLLKRQEPEHPRLKPWEKENARVILRATGRLSDFKVEDMDKDNLREIIENVRSSRRMHEEELSNC
ncbi:MAG: hypothetical protein PHR77_03255 [Kiritimatiellae bacterium]|nr:hypothetical protein [Kiritimatiellia bacterium]MDD5519575.1 hypothetical protein [Kiritimatiellia bacterium]